MTRSSDHSPPPEVLFQGDRFVVKRLTAGGPNGARHVRDVVVHPGAVVILPLLDAGTVVLIENRRIAAGQTLWELPAGTLEPPEPPEACAARELIEETGYRAERLERLTSYFTSPGISTEMMHAFAAEGLQRVGQALEQGEEIEPRVVPLDEAVAMVRDGRIRDAKTIATLLYYTTFRKDA